MFVTIVMTYWQLQWCKSCVNLVCCIFWAIFFSNTWISMVWPCHCVTRSSFQAGHCAVFLTSKFQIIVIVLLHSVPVKGTVWSWFENICTAFLWKERCTNVLKGSKFYSEVFCTVVLKDIFGYNAEFFGIEVSFVSRCVESSFSQQSSIWFQFVHLTLDF